MKTDLHPREVVKFGLLVGFAAIFIDASVAHGLFWDNDPYWTYWITKTFLITTVFTLGTAFFGTGVRQGLAITAAHTLILEIYYQWLAPVGLPQEPEWLDFNHLWVTGVPAHYLAILGGYFIALWLWRRNTTTRTVAEARMNSRPTGLHALAAAVLVLILDGVITHGLLLQNFPGITYFVQHLLIGFVFLFFWISYAGADIKAWATGSLMLALVWTTYSLYLGPQGLPNDPPTYLGYTDLWTKSFPGAAVSALIGLWLASRFVQPRLTDYGRGKGSAIGLALLMLSVSQPASAQEGMPASASASGNGSMVIGPNPVDMASVRPMTGKMDVSVIDVGNRWSHVQNTDAVNVIAEFSSGGATYNVVATRAMPRHPLGKYTTWSGVIFRHEMHGNTGIGTARLPKMKPDIALYGWGEVSRDGTVISRMAPVHVMITTTGAMKGAILEVDTEDKALIGAPDGYITAMWPSVATIAMPDRATQRRMIIGWAALIAIVVLFGWLAIGEERKTRANI